MKIIALITLTVAAALLVMCFGQTEYYNSTTKTTTILNNGSIEQIEFQRTTHPQQSELNGIWKAENIAQNTYAQLRFTEDGMYQEILFEETSNEKLASFEGYYHLTDGILIITLTPAEKYTFSYTMPSPLLLKLSPVTLD